MKILVLTIFVAAIGLSVIAQADYALPYSDSTTNIDEMKINTVDAVNAADCGAWGYLDGDIDQNCIVDTNDLSILVSQWIANTDPAKADAIRGIDDDYNTYNIPMAVSVPTIDGILTTDEWDDAKIIPIVYPDNVTAPNVGSLKYDEPASAADFSAYYHYKWDQDYLYVGIKVYDDVLVFNAGYPDDYVTLAINPNQAGFSSADVAIYNMYIDVAGNPQVVNQVMSNQAFNAVNSVKASSTQIDGWSFEVACKWSDLGGYVPIVGDTHGMAVIICDNDSDDGVRDTFLYDSGSGDAGVIGNPSAYRVATLTSALACGDYGYIIADIDGNCVVDMADFLKLAGDWMMCTDPIGVDCIDLH